MGDKSPRTSASDDSPSGRSTSRRGILRSILPRGILRSSSPQPSTSSPSPRLVTSERFSEASSISFLDDLTIGELIGQGSYGKVYIALHSPDNKEFAIKKVQLKLLEPKQIELVQSEVDNMLKVDHPGLLKLEHSLRWTSFNVIVMPLMAYSSCDNIIKRYHQHGLPEMAIGCIIKDIINALLYLHGKMIIHRSIKASHILIKDSGEAVLSGFRHMVTLPQNQNKMTEPDVTDMSHYINWMSPEMQDQQEFGLKSDMYSVGITICELGNGVVPYSDLSPSDILTKKLEGPTPKLWGKHLLPSQEASGTTPAYFKDDAPPGILRSSINYPYRRRSFSLEILNFVAICTEPTPDLRIGINQAVDFQFYKAYAKESPAATITNLKGIGPPIRFRTSEAAGQSQAPRPSQESEERDLS